MNCEYITKREGRNVESGKAATHRGEQGSRKFYCAEHNTQVTRPGGLKTKALKRTN